MAFATKTALFSHNQSGGVFVIDDLEQHPGDVWFVGSTVTGAADTAGAGQNPTYPFATIDYAVSACTASQGDVVYVLPGHNETITAATSCNINVAGVSVIGLGRGKNRPTLDIDNTAGTIEMDAANTRLSNVILRCSVSNATVGINVDADDVELDHLYFTYEDTGDDWITMIDLNAYDRTHIHDCVFETEEASAQSAQAIKIIDANDVTIENNIFRGFWSASAILGLTTLSARLLIKDNVIYNSVTTVYGAIDPGAVNTTGMVVGNHITQLYATAVAKVVRVARLTFGGNTYANAVSERSALLVPATSAG